MSDLSAFHPAGQTAFAARRGSARDTRPNRGKLSQYHVEHAKRLLLASLAEPVPLDNVAAALDVSLCHFIRAFRQRTGQPPYRWLAAHRLERAKNLLADPAMSLCDIALSCGFYDQSHFTKAFNRRFGQAPGAWRRGQLALGGPERSGHMSSALGKEGLLF
jgi:transcriptional regulator GlxA family with amidase domain